VFGRAAAHRVEETVRPGESHAPLPEEATDRAIARLDRIRWSKGETGAGAIRLAMQQTMQRHCAVFRDGPLLVEGLSKLDEVIEMMGADHGVTDRSMTFNTDLAEALELDNMLAQASVSLHSAIGRTESRGAHARADFPKRDDENWLRHTLAWLGDDGRVRLDYRPVHLQPLSNEVSSIPPKERVYRAGPVTGPHFPTSHRTRESERRVRAKCPKQSTIIAAAFWGVRRRPSLPASSA
jgi:succinate dehydrogenase / fumarate reductase flavoprotein subunit